MKEAYSSEVEKFRNGIFSLNTRRFGSLAELMIQILYQLEDSKTLAYDKVGKNSNKIEVKFSTVMKKNSNSIKKDNVIEQAIAANTEIRKVNSDEDCEFDCNIQQIKTKEFDILYYGLFFYDKIFIYKINSSDVKSIPGYSDKQHRGNVGEGQFHITNSNINFHKKYLIKTLSYDDLYEMFS